MPTQNEQAAIGFADAITRCDRAAALQVCHPDIELDSMLGISGRRYVGHDGILAYFDDVESAWEHWGVDVERAVEGPDGRVAIIMTMHARGKGSGVTLSAHTAHIWTLQDGRLRRNQLYREPELALRDLGVQGP
jgi:ketosteroid isomerase-like protein